jgi:hypothetical protein
MKKRRREPEDAAVPATSPLDGHVIPPDPFVKALLAGVAAFLASLHAHRRLAAPADQRPPERLLGGPEDQEEGKRRP